MNSTIKEKREELKALSAPFKLLVKEGALNTINAGLSNYYAELGHSTLKSYRRWLDDGFQVNKGSKALLLWGEPKKNSKEVIEKGSEEKKDKLDFFPIAFVFSNLQVTEIKTGATPA